MMHPHIQNHADTGIALVGLSFGSAAMTWVADIDVFFRIGSSAIACASGVAALVYYGKRNGWW
jgi:hypothetical protein